MRIKFGLLVILLSVISIYDVLAQKTLLKEDLEAYRESSNWDPTELLDGSPLWYALPIPDNSLYLYEVSSGNNLETAVVNGLVNLSFKIQEISSEKQDRNYANTYSEYDRKITTSSFGHISISAEKRESNELQPSFSSISSSNTAKVTFFKTPLNLPEGSTKKAGILINSFQDYSDSLGYQYSGRLVWDRYNFEDLLDYIENLEGLSLISETITSKEGVKKTFVLFRVSRAFVEQAE